MDTNTALKALSRLGKAARLILNSTSMKEYNADSVLLYCRLKDAAVALANAEEEKLKLESGDAKT